MRSFKAGSMRTITAVVFTRLSPMGFVLRCEAALRLREAVFHSKPLNTWCTAKGPVDRRVFPRESHRAAPGYGWRL